MFPKTRRVFNPRCVSLLHIFFWNILLETKSKCSSYHPAENMAFHAIHWRDIFKISPPRNIFVIPLHDIFAWFTENVKPDGSELHPWKPRLQSIQLRQILSSSVSNAEAAHWCRLQNQGGSPKTSYLSHSRLPYILPKLRSSKLLGSTWLPKTSLAVTLHTAGIHYLKIALSEAWLPENSVA